MRRVLFDENMPRKLRHELPDCVVRTVQEEGWGSSLRNGELLRRAEESFDVLVTADRRMPFQQTLAGYSIGVGVIITPRLWYRTLITAASAVRDASVQPGEIRHVKVSA